MIDWTKPIELLDGTPVKVVHDSTFGPSPDRDGDYWIAREDGHPLVRGNRTYEHLCVHPDGREERNPTVIVRNRAADPADAVADFARANPVAFKDIVDRLGFAVSNREFAERAEQAAMEKYAKTLRDEFAMAALSAAQHDGWAGYIARFAYQVADAMLAERDKGDSK